MNVRCEVRPLGAAVLAGMVAVALVLACACHPMTAWAEATDTAMPASGSADAQASGGAAGDAAGTGGTVRAPAKAKAASYTMTIRYNANGATMQTSPYLFGSIWYKLNQAGLIQASSDNKATWHASSTELKSGTAGSLLKMVGRCGLVKTGYHSNAGSNNAQYYNLKPDGTGIFVSSDDTSTKAINGGTEIKSNQTTPVTLYVVWLPNTYTVAYDANGGSWAPGSLTRTSHTYDRSSSLTASVPTRSHHSFVGWQISGAGAVYSPGQSVSNLTAVNGATVTMTAVWAEDAKHTVTYDGNGGTAGKGSDTVYAGGSVTLPSATRQGFTFSGWSESGAAGSGMVGSYVPTGNVTLHALWEPDPAPSETVVSYDACGGGGYMPDERVEPGSSMVVAACSFTRPGYSFSGWNTASDGSGEAYESGDAISPAGDMVLFAQWDVLQLSFSVPAEIGCTLKANGDLTCASEEAYGISNLTDAGISVVGVKAAPAPGFTIKANPSGEGEFDYSFKPEGASRFSASVATDGGFAPVSWRISKRATLQISGFKGKIGRLKADVASRFSLGSIAWKLAMRDVTVAYDSNDGSGGIDSQAVGAQVPFAAPACRYERDDGKRFVSWCESPDGSGASYPAGTLVSFDEDTTLYALWE